LQAATSQQVSAPRLEQQFVFQPVPRIEDITARHLSEVPEHVSLAWIVFEAGG
jgi:hypothetical protein